MPETEAAVVVDPDVVLEPNFVERAVAALADGTVGAVVPLLLRPDEKTVDAYGTRLLPSLRAVNQYEGTPVSSFKSPVSSRPQLFGFTGACVVLRRAALNDCAMNGEVFDEDLFAYREDVDLSWRLKNRGWRIVGDPSLRATHARAVRAGGKKQPRVAQLSWRNYYLVLAKSVSACDLVRHAPAIIAEDVARELQLLVTPSLWAALPELFRLLPRAVNKRRQATAADLTVENPAGPYSTLPRLEDGRVNYHGAPIAPVLNCIVRRGEEILLLKRSERVSAYGGFWHTVAGFLDTPGQSVRAQAIQELNEELGLTPGSLKTLSLLPSFPVYDAQLRRVWRIYPVRAEVEGDPPIQLDWEHTEYRWVRREDLPRYQTIPSLAHVLVHVKDQG